jgi:hypothetical protein
MIVLLNEDEQLLIDITGTRGVDEDKVVDEVLEVRPISIPTPTPTRALLSMEICGIANSIPLFMELLVFEVAVFPGNAAILVIEFEEL